MSKNNIKSLRLRRGLSQLRVASGAALSIATVHAAENGAPWISKESKRKLCEFFDVSAQELFPGDKE